MLRFGLLGAAGFVAPRHLQAIKETNNNLLAAIDPHDSVGILDSYFPQADFFTEPERFERHLDRLKDKGKKLDYLSICSPNYLHDAHIRMGLKNDIDVVCEKPLLVNPKNVELLKKLEKETGRKINCILQLRLHDTIVSLKKDIDKNKIYDIDLTYITRRGKWYEYSWKGDIHKSGGLAMNIGIHFFDMLMWIFGECLESKVFYRTADAISGRLVLDRARVRWTLSTDSTMLPKNVKAPYRSILIDGKELEFSHGFTDLHTKSYKQVIEGEGFGTADVMGSLEATSEIMSSRIEPVLDRAWVHPLCPVLALQEK
tara:strand:+ start:6264 stop:7205 length:942 start_codon:yes stop_codon:yes gene_type:complete